ncbi:alkaline phosphatase PafA [Mucilaginibacter lacusdianchii]|uniref:alkaline phosphatase PafA n=1 Tax=Mucilaginibacter lacusdianchii TaxID=2684211 RepID=UPI00131DFC84|nr:alkaline phosphatase PafA [Mucilaginibacter sp. JXJ CY 39]
MKFKNWVLIGMAVMPMLSSAQKAKTPVTNATTLPRPKLVVGIVVDQMRWDYLYRFYDRYQTGGFKRMLNEGFTCENTHIDYLPTETAPGHSCIYTGSVPAIHGIAANSFFIQATGRYTYCTEDTTVQTVGSPSKAGQMSPRNLLASTITDELKLATNFRSKVIGIALKDRGSILPAGHTPNGAYWFDDASGRWITSTYYMGDLPAWVKQFNDQGLVNKYLSQPWNTLYPIESYVQSAPDNSPAETSSRGEKAPVFPHDLPTIKGSDFGAIRATPFGNTLTLEFAKTALDAEQLGKGPVTDFLAVSLSSTDYVGHQFGPNSVEAEDVYLRLDKDLAAFFSYLDAKVGKGNYTAFLTADHGAAHNATFAKSHNIPSGLWDSGAATKALNNLLEDKYKISPLIRGIDSYQINLNNKAIAQKNLNKEAIKKDCIDWLTQQLGVLYAVDMQKVQLASVPAELRERIINGYNADRSGEIQVILQPGWYAGRSATGASHGVSSPYDTHIPFVLMGWGIQHGSLNRDTHMTDISATLAGLLHIQMPSGCIGKVVQEALKK